MSSREQFEAWMTAEQWFHGSDFEWDDRRNCYSQFGIHLAYKAWAAATKGMQDELRAADELNKHLELAVRKAEGCSEALRRKTEAAEKRIAELDARELVVNLPAYVDGRTLGYGEVNHMIDLCADAIGKAGHAAGIITKVGE